MTTRYFDPVLKAISPYRSPVASPDMRKFYNQVIKPDYKTWLESDRITPDFQFDVFNAGEDIGMDVDYQRAAAIGKELRKFVKEISFEEDETMASMLTMTFEDPEFAVSNSGYLDAGAEVQLRMGYAPSPAWFNHRVRLIKTEPEFPRNGSPTYTIKGYDGRYKMISDVFIPKKRRGSKTDASDVPTKRRRKGVVVGSPSTFLNQRDDEIIDELAYHYGFGIDVDPTEGKHTRVKKKGTSDWEFILKLAQLNEYTAWVDFDTIYGWVIHFRIKPKEFTEGYVFEYKAGMKGTLLDFRPSEDLVRQVTDIEVMTFDKRLKKVAWVYLSENKHAKPRLKRTTNQDYPEYYGAEVKFKVGSRVLRAFNSKPFADSRDAKKFAMNFIKERQEDYMMGSGTIIGVENVRPRQIHRLEGLGKYSGEYYFKQTTHNFRQESIYETAFVAYRIAPSTAFQDFEDGLVQVKV